MGFPWCSNSKESTCQRRGQGLNPWSGKIPHAAEQLSPWATTPEPPSVELMPRNKRCHHSEKPTHSNEDPVRPKLGFSILLFPGAFSLHSPLHPCCCSVAQLCPTLCWPTDCSTLCFPVPHHLLEFAQTHVCWVSDATQQFHSLPLPSPPALNLSQNQVLFQWISSLHQVAKVLEFQLQHYSFQ